MKNKILILFICLSSFLTAYAQKEKICFITGKIINRPESTKLRLIKSLSDLRSNSAVIIPIKNGTFFYKIKFKDIEAYNLIFEDEFIKGMMRPITFFTTNGSIHMKLYSAEEFTQNIIKGGEENQQFIEHQKNKEQEITEKTKSINESLNFLQKNENYYSLEMKYLLAKINNTDNPEEKSKLYTQRDELYQSGGAISPAAKKINAQYDSIIKIVQNKEIEYIKKNVTIPSYYEFVQIVLNTKYSLEAINSDELCALQKKYADKFKDHPYTLYINEKFWQISNIKRNGNFYDFTLPDLNGKKHTLSDEIKGKYAIIDIWAPWCGSCLVKSREMKMVFEEYKNKNFTIVGIVSKYRKLNDVTNILKKEKYPWLTLIDKPELDSGINEHYGIEMAGGKCILVDKTGKILIVNPSIQQVRNILDTTL